MHIVGADPSGGGQEGDQGHQTHNPAAQHLPTMATDHLPVAQGFPVAGAAMEAKANDQGHKGQQVQHHQHQHPTHGNGADASEEEGGYTAAP